MLFRSATLHPPYCAAVLLWAFGISSSTAQTLEHTDQVNRVWNSGIWILPPSVPNAVDAAVIINRFSGGGNRTISAAGGPFTLGSLTWTNTVSDNDSLRNGQLLFESTGGVSTLTYSGSASGNLQIRNGASLAVGAGQTLLLQNASSSATSRFNFTTDGAEGTIAGAGTMIFQDTSGVPGDFRAIRFQSLSPSFSGIFRLESGLLELHTTGAIFGTGTLELAGGRVETNANNTLSNEVTISNGFGFAATNRLTLSGDVTLAAGQHAIAVESDTERLQISGAVSGTGGILKTGPGELRLTNAANTFSGPIESAGGELRFTSAGALGLGNSLTADGGRLAFEGVFAIDPSKSIFAGDGSGTSLSAPGGASVITYNGVIADKAGETGSWAKQGGGTLILGGANTFTGDVAVNNGTLTLNNLHAISSAASVSVNTTDSTLQLNLPGATSWQLGQGTIALHDGGTLRQLTGADTDIATLSQTIQLTGTGGTLNAPGDSRIHVAGGITGPGNLTKAGGGELRFTGAAKTYSGETNINNGRIRIDDDGIPTQTTAINLNDGNLRFGQRNIRTYSLGAGGNAPINILAGGGSIEYTDKFGAILTNPVAITGTGDFRSREAGSLFALTGPLTGAGTLNINQGSGGNPVQSGTIFLGGNASAFTGSVDVHQSTLRLGDTTMLGANQFNLQAPATLQVDVASPTQLGNVAATGNITLAPGSTLSPFFTEGLAPGTTTLTILETTGVLTDNGALTPDTGVMQLSKNVTPTEFQLVATVDYSGFGNLPLNAIQTAAGNYLNNASGGAALSAVRAFALNLEGASEVASFYDSVAAEELGGMMDTALLSAQSSLRSLTGLAPHLQNRLAIPGSMGVAPAGQGQSVPRLRLSASDPKSIVPGPSEEWSVFTSFGVQRSQRLRSFELGGYDASTQSFLAGADRIFSDSFAAGFFGGYEHSRTQFDLERGWATSHALSYGAFSSWLLPRGYVTAGVQHHRHWFDVERYSALGTARAKPEGDQLGLLLEGAAQLGRGPFSVIPTARLHYNHLWIDGFSESGAPIAQRFEDLTADSLLSGVGLRFGYTIPQRTFTLRPEVFAEYRHEFLDGTRALESDFLDSTGRLRIATPGRSSGYAVVGGALHATFSHSASAYLQYEAQLIDSGYTNHELYGGFRWHFPDQLLNSPVLVFSDSNRSYRETLRGSPLGDVIDFFNLRALVMLQYDHSETKSQGGAVPDPNDPSDIDFWFARRIRLSAEREFPGGFYAEGAFQFGEERNAAESGTELFGANVGWKLFEPFTLHAGLDKVPLGFEETTSSARLKTIERSAATRALGRLGGDGIGRSHWRLSAKGTLRELYTQSSGPVQRYDFHYEFAVANPREDVFAPWRDDSSGLMERWPDPSYYLRLHNEFHTPIGIFDLGADFADIPTFRARGNDQITGADAWSPFLNYNRGWFNFTATGAFASYSRDTNHGGQQREVSGFTLTPSYFITPNLEFVAMYSRFDTDGDQAIRLNQASRNVSTSYPDDRRFDDIEQIYVGLNHYLRGDDLKVMYGVEHTTAGGAGPDRPVSEEEAWSFRVRFQLRF